MNFPVIDWWQVGGNLVSVAVAYLLAMPVAWEREHNARSAGLRTFPLVAVASCGYILLATSIFAGESESTARIVQGLMTGIGFIGGGAPQTRHERARHGDCREHLEYGRDWRSGRFPPL